MYLAFVFALNMSRSFSDASHLTSLTSFFMSLHFLLLRENLWEKFHQLSMLNLTVCLMESFPEPQPDSCFLTRSGKIPHNFLACLCYDNKKVFSFAIFFCFDIFGGLCGAFNKSTQTSILTEKTAMGVLGK